MNAERDPLVRIAEALEIIAHVMSVNSGQEPQKIIIEENESQGCCPICGSTKVQQKMSDARDSERFLFIGEENKIFYSCLQCSYSWVNKGD